MTAPLVVFDLDGTLIDTAPDLVVSLNHTIGTAGLAPVTYEDLTHLVGQGARTMIARAFAMRERSLSNEELDRLFAVFIEHYRAGMPGKSQPYPGLAEALDSLEAAGYRFAVCTNKGEALALPLLEMLGLTRRFVATTGGDTFAFRKPDGRHILETIRLAGGEPDNSVMIGDSVNDILAARNAGVPSIGVTFGYTDIPVEQLGPDHVISHFSELTPELVADIIAKARISA